MNTNKILISTLVASIASGCTTVAQVGEVIDKTHTERREAIRNTFVPAERSRVVTRSGTLIPATAASSIKSGEWLRTKKVSFDIQEPTPISSLVRSFAEQGVNVSSGLNLSNYSYVGKVNNTDAETALRAVLGSVGLDYFVDDKRQLVTIKPVASKHWTLNIGNRRSSFSTDDDDNSSSASSTRGSTGNSASSGLSASSATSGFGDSQVGGGTGSGSQNTGSNNSTSGNGTRSESTEDFWASLSKELKDRLTIQVTERMPMSMNGLSGSSMTVPGIEGASHALLSGQGTEQYVGKQIGTYSLNPETGSITVNAPNWVLEELDKYFENVQSMYNTHITFNGEVVLVTTNKSDSEGIDLSAFAQWAGGKYGAIIKNNALGGLTISMPEGGGIPSLSTAGQTVGGPLMGIQYRGSNAADIFNAYLQQVGKVSVIQRPILGTTSGVPGVFRKKHVDYYNVLSQSAAAGGTGSAATATENNLIPVETGIDLTINPRVDVATGLIRAQLKLQQVLKAGTRNIPQLITFGDNVQSINTQIPLTTKQEIKGEVLLKDGDMIIVGGQVEDNDNVDENGLPGTNGPIGGVFGIKKANQERQTYYFALRVSVTKRQ